MEKPMSVAELADLLNEIGCPMDAEACAGIPADQAEAVADWAEAILSADEIAPPRPACLAARDVQRCRRCSCTQMRACPDGCFWHESDLCSECVAPGTLVDLRYWLERRPWVEILGPGDARDIAHYERFGEKGGLWFKGVVKDHYIPIKCGIGRADPSETGPDFEPDAVVISKFGAEIRIRYLPGANS